MIKPMISYYLLNALLVGCMTKRDTQMLGLKMPITEKRSGTNSEGNRQGGPLKRGSKTYSKRNPVTCCSLFPPNAMLSLLAHLPPPPPTSRPLNRNPAREYCLSIRWRVHEVQLA